MKKVLLAVLAGAVCIPAFAQPQEAPVMPAPEQQPAVEAPAKPKAEAFKQAREKHEAQMKAMQEKVNNLVAEYKKLKSGKKKDAKKAEIVQLVASIHEEQINFKQKQLEAFEKRLNQMKEELAKQNEETAKQAWVDEHTDKLIEENGDLRVLFDQPQGMPGMKKAPRGAMKGHPFGSGMKHHKGPRPEFKDVPPQEVPAP